MTRAPMALLLLAPALAGDAPGLPGPLRPADARLVEFALPSPEEAWLGASLVPRSMPPRVLEVVPDGPADAAGLRAGDLLASVGGVEPPDAVAAQWLVRTRVPGERVRIGLDRGGTPVVALATLGRRPGEGALFRERVFRLAVVPVTLEDLPRGASPDDAALERLFFSSGTHRGPLPSGRSLHGSLRDYYRDQSHGALDVRGRVLPTVAVPASRRAFARQPMGAGPDSLYSRAVAALVARDGASALDAFDGVAFLYPGPVASPPRRGLWPHRGSLRVGGRLLPYFVKNFAEGEIEPVGVFCHEFGHLLGLPDQYGTAHRTGVGDFCVMAIGHRGGGRSGADRPFGFCAWCRAVLGWTRPAAVDPFAVQELVLAPASSGPGEAFLVPGAAQGEAFLLENRPREGWDAELPGGGLLVWRVGGPVRHGEAPDEPWIDLVEAHGIAAPDATLLRPEEVPFPAPKRDALTEETHPGRAGNLRLSRIARLPDGSVSFRLGDPAPAEPVAAPAPRIPVDEEGFAILLDPVTGEKVRLFLGNPEDAPARDPAEVEPEEPVSGD